MEARDALKGGYTVVELRQGGWGVGECKAAGCTARECLEAGFEAEQVHERYFGLGSEVSLALVKALGSTPAGGMLTAGFARRALRLAGVSDGELRAAEGLKHETCSSSSVAIQIHTLSERQHVSRVLALDS